MVKPAIVAAGPVESLIRIIRGQRVILDMDLARVYGVTTKRLNEAVKRNLNRFPLDFMFQLTDAEKAEVVASCDHLQKLKFSPVLPYAFIEYGAFQAANVLNSDRAVQMGVFVVRAFVQMRETLTAHRGLAEKLAELERDLVARLDTHDQIIAGIIKELQRLAKPARPARKQIGFHVRERQTVYRTKRKP